MKVIKLRLSRQPLYVSLAKMPFDRLINWAGSEVWIHATGEAIVKRNSLGQFDYYALFEYPNGEIDI